MSDMTQPLPPNAPMPGQPAPAPGASNQVQIQFQPGSDKNSIVMSVNAPDGSADFQVSLETAMGVLIDLAKVLGQMTGVDVSEAFADLEGGGGEMPMGGDPAAGGMPMGGGDPMGGAPPEAGLAALASAGGMPPVG